MERHIAMGNTKTEALRALRRKIADEVYRDSYLTNWHVSQVNRLAN